MKSTSQTFDSESAFFINQYFIVKVLLIALLFNSCRNSESATLKNSNSEEIVSLDLSKEAPLVNEIKLSEFASNIDYIPLEYNSESILADTKSEIKLDKNNIFISNLGGVKQYNSNGKFVRNLFKVGRGPEECFCASFTIDYDSSFIYVKPNYTRTIMKYDYLNYSRENSSKLKLDGTEENIYYWNRKLLITYYHSENPPLFLKVIDLDSRKTIYSLKNTLNYSKPESRVSIFLPFKELPIQEYEDWLLFKEMMCDTIFQTKDLDSIKPRYILNFGNKKLSYEEYLNFANLAQPMKEGTLFLLNFFETKHNIIFILGKSLGKDARWLFSIFNKETKQIKFTYNGTIINDIDNGPDINILRMGRVNFVSIENKFYMYSLVQPMTLIELLKEGRLSKIQDSDTSKSTSLIRMIKKMNEFDNPVLMKI